MSNLKNRAIAAYYRDAAQSRSTPMQPTADEVECRGLRYVRLYNVDGLLAVYRVRVVNGQEVLKGMKRFPAELKEIQQ